MGRNKCSFGKTLLDTIWEKKSNYVLCARKEKKNPVDVLKHSSNRDKQVFHWMIPNWEGWHYLALKMLSALLTGLTSKYHSDLYCLNFLYTFATENKRESHWKVCENKVFLKLFNVFWRH